MEQKKLSKPREKVSLEESHLSVSVSALVIKKGQSGNDMITIYPHKIGAPLTQKNRLKATRAVESELTHRLACFISPLYEIPSSEAHYVPDIWRKALNSLYVISLEKQYQINCPTREEALVGSIMESC
jgi:hypothetical protein